jgi:V/A-type H+-transporting ATPase subunit I
MLLPESMSRIVIVGTKSRMEDAINAFYSEKSIHIIDHTTGDDGLSIGTTTETTSKASERLIKVRSMEKELGINKHTKTADIAVEEVQSRISAGDVEGVEDEVLKTVDARNDLTQKITELNSKKNTFELLKRLNELTLDQYSGYKSLAVLVGTTTDDASSVSIEDAEVFSSFDKKEGGVVAVFVKKENKEKAFAALADVGFTEIQVPACTEKVAANDACAKIDAEIEAANAEIEKCNQTLEELKEKYMSFLKGCDEELAIVVEKGSVPLRIAVSKYSYVIDAWVPTKKMDSVKANLERKLGDDIYVEFQETRGRKVEETEAQEPRFQNVPVKQNNGRIVCEYEYATSLVSVPKYNEIDPTFLIAIFLPLFFGFMVGDMGYAIPFIILGAYGLKKTKHKDWRAIALVLFFGGIWAFIFGLFFYGEMLGMHFVGGEWEAGTWVWHENHVAVGGTTVSWDWILGAQFPSWFTDAICSVGAWGQEDPNTFGVGVGKLEDVAFLLKLSVYIGVIHLLIGLVCALVNVTKQHGVKEAILEKGGIVFVFFGIIFLCLALTDMMFSKLELTGGTPLIELVLAIVCLVIGIVLNAKAEGGMQAIMSLPEVIGWILSYTRLAAITMSKAGMALAFNYIIFGMIMTTKATGNFQDGVEIVAFDPMGGAIMLIVGILLFCFLHLVVWTLGILSAGLHALRLQFVELMMRFYEGGGEAFAPLSEVRKKTFFSKNANNIKEV